ncbi:MULTISPECIES: hypothetical protein [unclassified Shewanella]|uniref:hypothetical protein n=1 Tax=unclassified Shewanella TaxID=196818 RepID=UPI0015E3E8A8|nr:MULTISPECIES: hypothetical protein [unclassified Shewanella]
MFRIARKTSYSNHLTDATFEPIDVILPPEHSHCGQKYCLRVKVNVSDDDFAKFEE